MSTGYYNLYHIYDISTFLIRHNVSGLLRHTVHEDTSALNQRMFRTSGTQPDSFSGQGRFQEIRVLR